MTLFRTIFLLILYCAVCLGRKHKLDITNDGRKYIALSTFGFYQGGMLDVQLKNFRATPKNDSAVFGFSLDRTINDAMNPYLDSHPEHCILQDPVDKATNESIIYFILELKTKKLKIKCEDQQLVHIYKKRDDVPNLLAAHQQKRQDADHCSSLNFDITSEVINGNTYYNASFILSVATVVEEGLYNLYFHNCPNYYPGTEVMVDFRIEIIEYNTSSFLSAGEIPLPTLYSVMAMLFLLSGKLHCLTCHSISFSEIPLENINLRKR